MVRICVREEMIQNIQQSLVLGLELVGLVGCIFWLFWFSFEGLVRYVCFVMLTLLGPAYLSTSKDPGDYLGIGWG